jgi:HSP20 family protein
MYSKRWIPNEIERNLGNLQDIDREIRYARSDLERVLATNDSSYYYPRETQVWTPELSRTLGSVRNIENTLGNMRSALEKYLNIASQRPEEYTRATELSRSLKSIRNMELEIKNTREDLERFARSTASTRPTTGPQGWAPELTHALESIRNAERTLQDTKRTWSDEWTPTKSYPLSHSKEERRSYHERFVDIYDAGRDIICRVEVPGARKEDIDVNVGGNEISISAERKSFREGESKQFYRCLDLPTEVIPGKTDATYEHGVLTITLPKVDSTKGTHRVKVK